VRLLRAISLFCITLLIVSVQCRATCVAVPHQTEKQAPECPLHKNKAPETKKCTHAPQWDVDDAKKFVATFEQPSLPVFTSEITTHFVPSPTQPAAPPRPPLILRI
jgi:hypothetical protein